MPEKNQIKLTLVKSLIGRLPNHLRTVEGLGLKRQRQTVCLKDTPSLRGMIKQVSYLLEIEEIS